MVVPKHWAATGYPVDLETGLAVVAAAVEVVSPSQGGRRWTSAASFAASSCLVVAADHSEEPGFRGLTLHHHQLADHSVAVAVVAAAGSVVGFVAVFVASARGIVAASASTFAGDLVAVQADQAVVAAVVQVVAVSFAVDLAVAGFAAVAVAAVATSDQEHLLALIQAPGDLLVLLKGSGPTSRGVHSYNQGLDKVPGASCKDPS